VAAASRRIARRILAGLVAAMVFAVVAVGIEMYARSQRGRCVVRRGRLVIVSPDSLGITCPLSGRKCGFPGPALGVAGQNPELSSGFCRCRRSRRVRASPSLGSRFVTADRGRQAAAFWA
jgi:hypothetical protein